MRIWLTRKAKNVETLVACLRNAKKLLETKSEKSMRELSLILHLRNLHYDFMLWAKQDFVDKNHAVCHEANTSQW